ncbi:restriction endonuclease [Salibacterium aidingense]|uniref:restriction endonuclease n=1 Tax=Salibacterium aidingense TaxID=384933 RepID=UPI0004067722|nr:restriction endonuclease [Salibacterium aidingense]
MKEKDIESLAGFVVIGSFLFVLWQTGSFGLSVAAGITAFFLIMVFIVGMEVLKRKRIRHSGIKGVDRMKGKTFELFLEERLKQEGYKVKRTAQGADYGVDLLLEQGNTTIAVQAKRYQSNVGVKAVQEVRSGMDYYQADQAWVITNSHYTSNAYRLAYKNKVTLIDRKQLITWLSRQQQSG